MKKILLATTFIVGSIAAISAANAAVIASGFANPFNASVTIVAPLNLTQTTPLSFGKAQVGASGGNLVLTNAGAISTTGTVTALSGHTAGSFTLTGDSTNQVVVEVAPAAGAPTGVTLSALDAKYGTNAAFTTTSAAFVIDGTSTLKIGGTLALTTAAVSGSIPYTIKVTYQ